MISDFPLYRCSAHSTVDRVRDHSKHGINDRVDWRTAEENDGQIHSERPRLAPISRPTFIFTRQVCVDDHGWIYGRPMRPKFP